MFHEYGADDHKYKFKSVICQIIQSPLCQIKYAYSCAVINSRYDFRKPSGFPIWRNGNVMQTDAFSDKPFAETWSWSTIHNKMQGCGVAHCFEDSYE